MTIDADGGQRSQGRKNDGTHRGSKRRENERLGTEDVLKRNALKQYTSSLIHDGLLATLDPPNDSPHSVLDPFEYTERVVDATPGA